jgi:hypothetical protein
MEIEKIDGEYKLSLNQEDIERLCDEFSDAYVLYEENDYEIPDKMQDLWNLLSPHLEK